MIMKMKCLCVALAVLGVVILPELAPAAIPGVTKPTVRIAYVIPSNRVQQANGVANLQNGFLVYREWCREQQELNGFGPMTFNLETEADGWTPKVHVVQSGWTDSYIAADMWSRCATVVNDASGGQVWADNNVWVVVGGRTSCRPTARLQGTMPGGQATRSLAWGWSVATCWP